MAYGLRSVAVVAAAAMTCIGSAAAQDVKLPGTLTVTAYETGSNAFNQAVAVGQMLKNKYGTDLRVLPAGNDVARLGPLRAGRAQASAMGVGVYYAQEGVLEFATKEWGPQSLQLLLSATTCSGQALGIAKDLGVSQVKDLKGKRMGWVVGSPAINQSLLGLIAFGGLTKADVKLVDYSSYGAMMKGLVNNEVDIIFASTISGQAKEAENSPRGIMWPPMPPSDTAGWERVQKLAPYFYPHKSTCGAGYAKGETIEVAVYPYPIFMAYASQPAELVHALTKAMIANYDSYKDAVVGVDGLEARRQNQKWIVPYHPGAVRALKEAGVWTDEGQKNNDALIARQKVLAEAWATYLKTNPPDDKDAFRKGWMEARRTALTKAGQPVGFDE
ncbi:MAG: C4-dicarboxylate ABC transporter [Kaistia sp. SCN 65-12]|nr:MAG: C4-dicarboxylate ABC transporter [Kaistia sp. SCN 65-12]